MEPQESVLLGTRFCASSGHLATIRYVGRVDGTQGIWYGVEWDDPTRGKHDGVKDGRRYFACRVPNSGSFIRPSSAISFGVSFLTALSTKYVEETHSASTEETIILGSSNGAIEVEAVGFDKVRNRLRALERLREVSLDHEKVASSDPPGQIHRTCPNIRGLDLTANLLSSWKTVADIAFELPRLERLVLNRNRFLPLQNGLPTKAFDHIAELQLNSTLIQWEEFREVVSYMPGLQVVEVGYNRLSSLSTKWPRSIPHIQCLNFDTNQLSDWSDTAFLLSEFVALHRLVLSSNGIRTIPNLKLHPSPIENVKQLALSANQLAVWQDVDRLAQWCPRLETLSLAGNPLTEDSEFARYSRQLVIAKIPSLLVLDATAISSKERIDSELFYLSFVSKYTPGNDEEKSIIHPQWTALCNKHGRPPEGSRRDDDEDKLSKSLITINVHRCLMPPSERESHGGTPIPLKVLSTMKMAIFRLKLTKALKLPPRVNKDMVEVWIQLQDGFAKLHDDHTLDWYGIENKSDVFVYITEE